MEITWLAHSCFRLRGANVTILTDPFPSSIGGSVGQVEPTIVTVSNKHPNHSHLEGLEGDFRLLEGPGEYAISGVYIRGIMTPSGAQDPPQHRNTAYFFEMDGLRLCHLGDLAGVLSDQHVEELTPLDVLFLPVGGNCTLELDRVGGIVQALEPRIVVPMHYRVPGTTVELGSLDPFLREMGIREAEPQPRLTVTATSLPAETTVVVLRATGIRESSGK